MTQKKKLIAAKWTTADGTEWKIEGADCREDRNELLYGLKAMSEALSDEEKLSLARHLFPETAIPYAENIFEWPEPITIFDANDEPQNYYRPTQIAAALDKAGITKRIIQEVKTS